MSAKRLRVRRALAALLAILAIAAPGAPAKADVLPLWEGEAAPYAQQSPEQAQPSLTAYEAEGAKIALVLCPGGGYLMKSKREGKPVARRMRRGGISAFVLDYRISPCHWLAPLADAQRAIRLVRGLGYEYVGIMGFSAGGHLAVTAATHWDRGDPDADDPLERLSCRPDFFVSCYAVTSFARYPQQPSCTNLLGDAAEDAELLRFFSAEENVDADTPPGFIWHCAGDTQVSPGHSLALAQALTDAGVDYELHIYPGGKHGVVLAADYSTVKNWPKECLRFIKQVCGG